MVSNNLLQPWKLLPQKTYIFRNANVIDVESGDILLNRDVKIATGIIISVTPAEHDYILVYTADEVHETSIDLKGKYLCPGLIDCHVHLAAVPGQPDLSSLYTMFNLDPAISTLRQPYVCQQMLRRGFTSARDCGGAPLALKQAINEGVIQGPRLFLSGHALSQTGGHGDSRSALDHSCCPGVALGRVCDGVAECVKAAREELRCGADFIKIMTGGGVASPTDAISSVQFTREEVRAICEVAHNAGTYVTAHAYTSASIRHAVENGVTGIEHGNLIDKETAKFMADNDVYLTPTLVTYAALASEEFNGFLPEEGLKKNKEVLNAGLRSLEIAEKAGLTMCFGTDLLGPMGVMQTKEFALRAKVMNAKQILQSATINGAKRVGKSESLGQVEKGFAADLLILNKNPLEDITIFERPERHLLAVIKDGRIEHSRWSRLPQDVSKGEDLIE